MKQSMMTTEEIIEKAKRNKKTEKKIAVLYIVFGTLILVVLLYFTYDLRKIFDFFYSLFDIRNICDSTESEAQEKFKTVIMMTGLFSLLICITLHKAISMLVQGIGLLKGNKERDLLILLYEEKLSTHNEQG